MPDAYQIQQVQEHGTLRLAWDNRTAPKQNGLFIILLVFWLVWMPATIYMTDVLFRGEVALCFGVLWCTLGWLGTVTIPIGLLGRWRSEWVVISPNSISYGHRGFLAPRLRTYPIGSKGPGLELVFGFLTYPNPERNETLITLSLFVPSILGFRKRVVIGYWLTTSVKEQIFIALKTFVEAHKIPVVIKDVRHPKQEHKSTAAGSTFVGGEE